MPKTVIGYRVQNFQGTLKKKKNTGVYLSAYNRPASQPRGLSPVLRPSLFNLSRSGTRDRESVRTGPGKENILSCFVLRKREQTRVMRALLRTNVHICI